MRIRRKERKLKRIRTKERKLKRIGRTKKRKKKKDRTNTKYDEWKETMKGQGVIEKQKTRKKTETKNTTISAIQKQRKL